MSDKEIIKNRVEWFTSPVSPEQFAELSESENSLIILEVALRDYTLTEIARIVESNNAHVTALSVLSLSGGSELMVSLKLDVDDPTAILRSFERFSYNVIYYHMREGEVTDRQRERLDELMYYLEM
jgi:PleD family two-component response regulator